jgi:hypothetical protein
MTDIAIHVENLSKQYRISGPLTALRTGVGLMAAEGNPIESGEAVGTPPDGGRWVSWPRWRWRRARRCASR